MKMTIEFDVKTSAKIEDKDWDKERDKVYKEVMKLERELNAGLTKFRYHAQEITHNKQ